MTRLFNDPADFPLELIDGFVAAHPDEVMAVPGGVVRATAYDEVAVIVGGGTGHYPAFCGLVGEGVAHAAAMGNIFSSPSAQQAYSVARAADRGHGVVFTFGNYAGDVLHFGEAAERLRADGIPTEIVLVTDDIASAPVGEEHRRRGIAGDLTVFKTLGAAAGEGYDLAETVRVGRHANDRTRSFGVAFAGCTLPGASAPLFTVPEGFMSLGLGIHGEPGISDVPIPPAADLAALLVERVLAERPEGAGDRVAVLLNGLGTVKYEELFVVYATVARILAEAGLAVVSPDVGELCTSLNMAGISLTLFWLDDELERLWTSPSAAPAYRKGAVSATTALSAEERTRLRDRAATPSDASSAPASDASRASGLRVVAALDVLTRTVIDAADELGRIDAVAGDGDHGIGMERGARAALDAARAALAGDSGAGTALARGGTAWADIAGGTSGALWGAALRAIGGRFGDAEAVTAPAVADAILAARDEIARRGGAAIGDKTMMDVLLPYADRVAALDPHDPTAWREAAAQATADAEATRDLVPRLGRARPLAARSVGTPDAGATSLALIITAVTDHVLGDASKENPA
ncbi:dihydroxyacetone kinase family protein [Microbacterium testaceum]|uniref:dihydroxyacetone kinase family protein n=1 Tax=Microbacterium testaceum TaxID=2033 RepID=UPI000733E4BF|nr:dihydroxyacetone kinase family protein [Microbacterium testaceum]KTS05246.1 dihydroxyacetone kinase [Microbacterium testaceum]